MIQQAYTPGYIDGVMHGLNLSAGDQEDIRRTFGQELPARSTDHQTLRNNTRDTVNNLLGKPRSRSAILGTLGVEEVGEPLALPRSEDYQIPA